MVITRELTRKLRYAGVAGLTGVVGAAVVGLGYASPGGPASASQYQYKKVTICHHTGSQKNPHRTITVSRNAVPAHTAHGDNVGPCPTTTSIRTHSSASHVQKFHKQTTLRAELKREAKAKKAKAQGKGKGKAKGKKKP